MQTPTSFFPTRARVFPLAPGDQVIRYVNGQPFFCTVISVERDQKIRVSCQQWPSGYSAMVDQTDLTALNYRGP
jgi:hypothetical protein